MRAIPTVVFSLACLAVASGAWADNGKGHGHGHENGPGHIVIGDHDRAAVYSYYRTEFVGGHCPPGLAKRDSGCLPPGLAKRAWSVGVPLASAITFCQGSSPGITVLPRATPWMRSAKSRAAE